MEKQNKKYLKFFIFGQFIICIFIMLILSLLSRNISRHNVEILRTIAINDTKKYMSYTVDDMILHISLNRNAVIDKMNELIKMSSYQLESLNEDDINKEIDNIEKNLKETDYGKYISFLCFDNGDEEIDTLKKSAVSSCAVYKELVLQNKTIFIFVEQEAIDNIAKSITIDQIRNRSYRNSDNVSINEILNYGGGDKYAKRVISYDYIDCDEDILSTASKDNFGNFIYLKELKGIEEKGEMFQIYYSKEKNNGKINEYLRYSKLYAPFDWVIVVEEPLDNILKDSHQLNYYNNKTIFMTTIKILLTIVIIFLFGVIIILRIHRKYMEYVSDFIKSETELDSLTKIYTRKMAEKYLNNIINSNNGKEKFLIILIDIDDFKKVNDSYGHIIGDEVLRKIAQNMCICINKDDKLFRWGGEEFLIVCKEVEDDSKLNFAERILSNVHCVKFQFDKQEFSVTVSMGGTYIRGNDVNYTQAIIRADKALYIAKNNGKNRYCHE
ncbi:MAG: diguanylate cyclase domain-containing protein [Proteocatella sp.]